MFRYKDFTCDWEVEGIHFDERAKSEEYVRELLAKNTEVGMSKNGKLFAVFYKNGNSGEIKYHKIK